MPYLTLHQTDSHCLPHLGDSLRLCQTQPSCFQWLFHTHGLSWLMLHFPKFSQTSNIWPLHVPCLLPSDHTPGINSSLGSQLEHSWAPPNLAQGVATYRLLCSFSRWPWTEHRWRLTLACISQEVPEPAHPVDSYRPCRSTTTQPPPQMTHSRGRLRGHQSPAELSFDL